jgi:type II secretory pathway component PulM
MKVAAHWGDITLPALRNWLGGFLGNIKRPHLTQRPHPLIAVFCALALIWLLVDFWVLPYAQDLQGRVSLRPAQWAQLENLIKLSKTSQQQSTAVEALDEVELQKIRSVLQSKNIKPTVLRLTVDNPPRIELQASNVPFSSVVDALEALRLAWNIYPERVDISSTSAISLVNVSASLKQFGNQNSVLSLSPSGGEMSQ